MIPRKTVLAVAAAIFAAATPVAAAEPFVLVVMDPLSKPLRIIVQRTLSHLFDRVCPGSDSFRVMAFLLASLPYPLPFRLSCSLRARCASTSACDVQLALFRGDMSRPVCFSVSKWAEKEGKKLC